MSSKSKTKPPAGQVLVAISKEIIVTGEEHYVLLDLQSEADGWRNFLMKRFRDDGAKDSDRNEWRLRWNGHRLADDNDVRQLLSEEWDPEGDIVAWIISTLAMDDLGMLMFEMPKRHVEATRRAGIFDRRAIPVNTGR